MNAPNKIPIYGAVRDRPVAEFNEGPLTLEEQMKIVSLMENLPEAAMVRKALRFYEIPSTLRPNDYKWGENSALMKVLEHYECPQNSDELAWMLERIRGKRSLLEVGSSFGGTLKRMASVLLKGAKIVSVDLACDTTPPFLNPLASLKDTCCKIGLMGGSVELLVGNSHDPEVVAAASKYAPFDFGFIDGDHSYEGIKQDWENYGPMCKTVGFHDIAGPLDGCKRFWDELKAEGKYRTEEFQGPEDRRFGIGIVYRE